MQNHSVGTLASERSTTTYRLHSFQPSLFFALKAQNRLDDVKVAARLRTDARSTNTHIRQSPLAPIGAHNPVGFGHSADADQDPKSSDFLGPISGRPVLSRHSTVPDLDISELFTPTPPPVKDEPVSALVPPSTPPRSASQLAALRKVGRDAPLKPRPAFSTSLPEGSQAPGLRSAYWSSSSSLSDKKTPEPEEKPVSTMPGEDENRSASQAYFQSMPLRNERRAPRFDGHGAYLAQFFRDFETVAVAAGLENRQWITRVMDYAPAVDYELWKSIAAKPNMTWATFKSEIAKFYAGADHERRYTVADLERLCETFGARTSVSRDDFSDFYRKFYTIATYLETKSRLSSREESRLLLNAFHLDLRNQIRAQLRAVKPSHHPDDPFPVSDIVDAINIVLAISSVDAYAAPARATYQPLPPPSALPTVVEPRLPPPRPTYDASNLLAPDPVDKLANRLETALSTMLTATVESFANMAGGQRGPPGPRFQNQGYQPIQGCVWCASDNHWSRTCPKRAEYEAKGMIVRSPADPTRFCLPDGSMIGPRYGRTIGALVEDWHRQRPSPLPRTTPMTPATGSNAIPTSTQVQSNILRVVEVNHVQQNQHVGQTNRDTQPEVELPMATSTPYGRVDGEENEYGVSPDDLPILEATHAALTMKIEAARRASRPNTRSMSKNEEEKPSNPAPKTQQPLSPQAPPKLNQAPIAEAVTQPPPSKYIHPNAVAPPQFRFVTPIEDPARTASLAERSLDSPVSLSVRELLGVAPDLRKAVRELVTTKKVPLETVAPPKSYVATVEHDVDDVADSLVSVLLQNLKQQEVKATVANHTETLRTLELDLDGKVKVHAILDEGSQIIGLRRDIWERLGLPLRSDHTMVMESANGSTSRTLGVIPDLLVRIGTCEFRLQVQVVEEAGYEMLLGRPFHVLAQAQMQHHRDGSGTITLTDPRTRAVITVPTKARGEALHRVAVDF
ncbi:hypothetical protein D9611_008277 [Ephemerocybe angulata]|uniref:Peptidase A2 domain-containing protein n=1 Tax=Ephemerocybe angulata TaxID=980116 RepID=A0A8H5BKL8_9AGAR|nr:hypothetical protein D9611_008277 [Tulosesus angulatus]